MSKETDPGYDSWAEDEDRVGGEPWGPEDPEADPDMGAPHSARLHQALPRIGNALADFRRSAWKARPHGMWECLRCGAAMWGWRGRQRHEAEHADLDADHQLLLEIVAAAREVAGRNAELETEVRGLADRLTRIERVLYRPPPPSKPEPEAEPEQAELEPEPERPALEVSEHGQTV